MIITLAGDDTYVLKAELDSRVTAFVQQHGDLALERYDGEEASSEHILDSANSMPFLTSNKMIIVRSAAAQKDMLNNIESWAPKVPDTIEIILTDAKFDKRARYYKLLQKHTDFKEFVAAKQDSSTWIVGETKARGGTISKSDALYLVQRVGDNKVLLSNELEKLILFEPNITRRTIDELCEPSPQSTVFQLIEAAFNGDYERASKLYDDQRAQQVEPLAILAMIAWQLHVLAVIKTAGNMPPDQIARHAKLNPFVVRKSQGIARRLSLAELKSLVHQTVLLDTSLKSKAIDADEAIHQLLLSLKR